MRGAGSVVSVRCAHMVFFLTPEATTHTPTHTHMSTETRNLNEWILSIKSVDIWDRICWFDQYKFRDADEFRHQVKILHSVRVELFNSPCLLRYIMQHQHHHPKYVYLFCDPNKCLLHKGTLLHYPRPRKNLAKNSLIIPLMPFASKGIVSRVADVSSQYKTPYGSITKGALPSGVFANNHKLINN